MLACDIFVVAEHVVGCSLKMHQPCHVISFFSQFPVCSYVSWVENLLTKASNADPAYFLFFQGEAFLMLLELYVELLPRYPIIIIYFLCGVMCYMYLFSLSSFFLFYYTFVFMEVKGQPQPVLLNSCRS